MPTATLSNSSTMSTMTPTRPKPQTTVPLNIVHHIHILTALFTVVRNCALLCLRQHDSLQSLHLVLQQQLQHLQHIAVPIIPIAHVRVSFISSMVAKFITSRDAQISLRYAQLGRLLLVFHLSPPPRQVVTRPPPHPLMVVLVHPVAHRVYKQRSDCRNCNRCHRLRRMMCKPLLLADTALGRKSLSESNADARMNINELLL